ncbi:amidohydrolase family protein [Niastella vici]|uniref:amidohydrolase family protein n=1 Tax=Niastella vici TaxID=1703345 RepID=UPI0009BCC7EB|nr:amidohydrolase family protein [Niastella vici]
MNMKKYYDAAFSDDPGGSSERRTAVIDAHAHFWKYDKKTYDWIDNSMKTLQQDYLPEHLSLVARRNNVDGVVAVQATQTELETHFLIELAKTHSIIKGVVGWIDLQAENIEERLRYFSQYPIIKGYRHVVQGEPGDFLYRENFRRGVAALQAYNYTYDILIYHHQLQPAIDFVKAMPAGMPFVIDHCAKPDIRHKNIDEWRRLMKEIATFPNVNCKLSGLFTEAAWKEWSAADFYPYLDVVFEAFGPNRLLFGSDWPVMLLSGIYIQWKSLLEKYMENYTPEDREKVFGLNAIQFYNL